MAQVFIGGVPFMALGHHDGRFVRTGGLFAFARRTASGTYLVLHFEMTAAINQVAGPGHPRWGWCLGEGLDTLLVHMAGRPARLPKEAPPDLETVLWHPDAEVIVNILLPDCDLPTSLTETSADLSDAVDEPQPPPAYQPGFGS